MKYTIFIILLLIPIVHAAKDDIFTAKSMDLHVELDSRVQLTRSSASSEITYVKVKLFFFPMGTWRQEIKSLHTLPAAVQKEKYLLYTWDTPMPDTLPFKLDAQIETKSDFLAVKSKVPFPLERLDPSLRRYIQPTLKIDITDDIISLASGLAEGEDDLYRVVYLLSNWTKENVNYTLDTMTADASQKSSWVLEHKYGVCDEITNLFISLVRSLGIPARFVSGISYTNSDLFSTDWGLHGWAEVYFPGYGWVPFDVTYGQLGYVDAGHIKLRESLDSDKSSLRYEWKSHGVDLESGQLNTGVVITKEGNKRNNLVDMELHFLDDEVDFGSFNLVEVRLRNNQDYYVTTQLTIAKPKEVKLLGESATHILLAPGEKKEVYFVVKVKEDLRKEYLYTFPIAIRNSFGIEAEETFQSAGGYHHYSQQDVLSLVRGTRARENKASIKNVSLSCHAASQVILGEIFPVNCSIRNAGNAFLNEVSICLKEDCQNISLGISQQKWMLFQARFGNVGEKPILIRASGEEVVANERIFVDVLDKPNLQITNVSFPSSVSYGDKIRLSFILERRSYSKPENVRVLLRLGRIEQTWAVEEFNEKKPFLVQLQSTQLSDMTNKGEIQVRFADREGEEYSISHPIAISLADLSLLDRIRLFLQRIVSRF